MTQGQFFSSGVQWIWIQSFHSPRLAALPKLKNPLCPTIYPQLWREEIDTYLYQGHKLEEKCKQFCPGFELRSLISFLMMIKIMLSPPPWLLYSSIHFARYLLIKCMPIQPYKTNSYAAKWKSQTPRPNIVYLNSNRKKTNRC